MATKPKLDQFRFDAIVQTPNKLWGAVEIARVLGCSVASVYRWAEEPGVPIYRPGGRYFAYRNELERWLKSK